MNIDLGVIALGDSWLSPYDWSWLLRGLLAVYLLVLHLIVFYVIGGNIIVGRGLQ